MRRVALLAVTLVFLTMLLALVIDDVAEYGLTPLAVVAVLILLFFAIAIVGALRDRRPPE